MTTPSARPTAHRTSFGRASLSITRRYATVGLIVVLVIVFSFASPTFLTSSNLTDLLITEGVPICIAFAAMFPLIIGEFDLSLGYLLGFDAIVGAQLALWGLPSWLLALIMIALGALIGFVNGILTVWLRISAFIATLATGIILGALSNGISNGQILFGGVGPSLVAIGRGSTFGVGNSIWIALGMAIILFYIFEHTPLGRHFYAIGGSEAVAFLAGVSTRKLRVSAYTMAGLLTGIGGVFELGNRGGADPSFGSALLLPAYAAVFLGVTTHRPGQYNIIGTVVAIILLAVGFNGLSLIGIPFWAEPLFDGLVLLVAVLIASREARQVKVGM